MKVRVKHILALLFVAAIVCFITLVSAGGQAADQRPSPTDATCTSLWTPIAASGPPSPTDFRWQSDEQYQPKLRYFVQSRGGHPAVAALFYTGYPFRAELLGLTSTNAFR